MKGLDFLTSFLYESDFVCMVIQFEFRLFLLLLVLGQYDDHSPRMRVICRISRAGGMFIRWHLAGESEICSERASESVVLPLGGLFVCLFIFHIQHPPPRLDIVR